MGGSKAKRLAPIHPGQVLQEILSEAELTVNALAMSLRVPANRIGAITKGRRGITADTALRLARYFGTTAQMWINLQARYDLEMAEDSLKDQIEREVLPCTAA
jgi:addiction module HigA family antidote